MPLIVGFGGNLLISFAAYLHAGVLVGLILWCGLSVLLLSIFLMFIKIRDTAKGLHAVTRKDFHDLCEFMNGILAQVEIEEKEESKE